MLFCNAKADIRIHKHTPFLGLSPFSICDPFDSPRQGCHIIDTQGTTSLLFPSHNKTHVFETDLYSLRPAIPNARQDRLYRLILSASSRNPISGHGTNSHPRSIFLTQQVGLADLSSLVDLSASPKPHNSYRHRRRPHLDRNHNLNVHHVVGRINYPHHRHRRPPEPP